MTDNSKTPGEVLCDALLYAPLGLAFEARKLFPQLAERGRNQVQTARYIGEFVVQKAGTQLAPELEKASRDLGQLFGSVLTRIGLAVPPLFPVGTDKADPDGAAAPPPGPPEQDDDPAADLDRDAAGVPEGGAEAVSSVVDAGAGEVEALEADAVEAGPDLPDAPAEDGGEDVGQAADPADDADETDAPDADELPIADYDSLAASQVVPRLSSLGVDELSAVRTYESSNRGRRTILNRVEQLLAQRRSAGG